MFAEFEKYIRGEAALTADELKLLRETGVERTLRRKDFLLQDGEICRHKTFVSKGMLRTYRTTEDGGEHIMQFSPENNWTTDPESYEHQTPSCYNIEALEYSEVVMWTRNDFHHLVEHLPAVKAFTDRLVTRNLYLARQRIFISISASAEEKYDEFARLYPGILNRVPLHMVASFLGVSRETLSRIRHAQVSQ